MYIPKNLFFNDCPVLDAMQKLCWQFELNARTQGQESLTFRKLCDPKSLPHDGFWRDTGWRAAIDCILQTLDEFSTPVPRTSSEIAPAVYRYQVDVLEFFGALQGKLYQAGKHLGQESGQQYHFHGATGAIECAIEMAIGGALQECCPHQFEPVEYYCISEADTGYQEEGFRRTCSCCQKQERWETLEEVPPELQAEALASTKNEDGAIAPVM